MAKPDLHARLRQATSAVHERLHHHEGLAAVAAGTINLADYRLLLGRLWGFHQAFEAKLREAQLRHHIAFDLSDRLRSRMIESDIAKLGGHKAAVAQLPRCETLKCPRNEAEFMGALYVVEGSTLGGTHLARALEPLIGSDTTEGRRFFLGYGKQNGAMWRALLCRLEETVDDSVGETDLIEGAVITFRNFEGWMESWKTPFALQNGPGASLTLTARFSARE